MGLIEDLKGAVGKAKGKFEEYQRKEEIKAAAKKLREEARQEKFAERMDVKPEGTSEFARRKAFVKAQQRERELEREEKKEREERSIFKKLAPAGGIARGVYGDLASRATRGARRLDDPAFVMRGRPSKPMVTVTKDKKGRKVVIEDKREMEVPRRAEEIARTAFHQPDLRRSLFGSHLDRPLHKRRF